MWRRLCNAWRTLWARGDSPAALRSELASALRRVMDLEKALGKKEVELVRLPNDETQYQYLETISQFHAHPWIKAFFVMRERELISKFKAGGDAEILRGGLVCLEDVVSSMEAAALQFAAMKEGAE